MRKSVSDKLVGTVVIIAGMSGVFLSRMTPLRAVTTCMVIAATVTLWVFNVQLSFCAALVAYSSGFAVRYAVLFLSFARGGLAARLRARFGEARGFAIYEAATALLFFMRGVTFAWLIGATGISVSLDGT